MTFYQSLFVPGLLAGLASPLFAQAPAKLSLRTLSAQMKFDLAELRVQPGAKVSLTFENPDDLPHNVVFCDPGTDLEKLVLKMLEKPEQAMKANFLPEDPKVWLKSRLLNPHEKQVLEFTAPSNPGAYPYVCTFPGHAATMRGVLKVLGEGPKLQDLKFAVYHGAWTKLPDFKTLKPHREGPVPDNLIALNFDDYKNQYGLVFTGKLMVPENGEYTFSVAGDDGVRLLIDGREVLKDDGIHPSRLLEAKQKLRKGVVSVRVEYFQAEGGSELYVGWRGEKFDATAFSKWTPADWKKAPSQKMDEFTGLPLEPKTEPIIYRNFIAESGNRGIGVGFPGGFNFSWNAESLNLALLWRGAFMDAARHWKNRGGGAQPPAGFDVVRPSGLSAAPLAVLASPESPWPEVIKGDAPFGYTWKGYRLDRDGVPSFLYSWNGVEVEDRIAAEGDFKSAAGKLVRKLKLTGTIPGNAWMLLAAQATFRVEPTGVRVQGAPLTVAGAKHENTFRVRAEGAKVLGDRLVIPARSEMEITYSWDSVPAAPAR
jgi:plastocyanin